MKENNKGSKKGRSCLGGNIFSNIILLACLAVFLFAAWKLWGYYKHYSGGRKEYENLRQYVTEKEPEKKKNKKKDKCPIDVDFDALRKINPQVVGWLYVSKSDISYPIVQAEDNEYYLHRTFEGNSSFVGAIFLDSLCNPDFTSDNSIVYGHNLRNGEMFGMLKGYYDTEYSSNADYRKHKKIWVVTPDHELEYEIFAAREIDVNEDLDVYTIQFSDVEEYENYLVSAAKKSLYKTEAEVSAEVPMLTLSTCTSATQSGRFVVMATQIQDRIK